MPRGTRKYIVDLQQIREALVQSGYTKLDQQAKALGVHRSTAWTIIKTRHKLGRLSAKTTQRILANPDTPPSVRSVIQKYLAERSLG
jgi:Mn-dependent DtxR family transcriptional regulator